MKGMNESLVERIRLQYFWDYCVLQLLGVLGQIPCVINLPFSYLIPLGEDQFFRSLKTQVNRTSCLPGSIDLFFSLQQKFFH